MATGARGTLSARLPRQASTWSLRNLPSVLAVVIVTASCRSPQPPAPPADFQGVVIGRSGSGIRETFKVRKVSYGVGVERTFPLHAPTIAKIERIVRGDVRRAKLYYLRDRIGKAAKIKEKRES